MTTMDVYNRGKMTSEVVCQLELLEAALHPKDMLQGATECDLRRARVRELCQTNLDWERAIHATNARLQRESMLTVAPQLAGLAVLAAIRHPADRGVWGVRPDSNQGTVVNTNSGDLERAFVWMLYTTPTGMREGNGAKHLVLLDASHTGRRLLNPGKAGLPPLLGEAKLEDTNHRWFLYAVTPSTYYIACDTGSLGVGLWLGTNGANQIVTTADANQRVAWVVEPLDASAVPPALYRP